jgi:FolB domain-containing protein
MSLQPLDKIIITDLLCRGRIGVPAEERTRAQDILINLTLFVDTRKAGETDDIQDSVDYSATARLILDLVEANQRHTLEALAADIADLCLSLERVEKVLVRVEKPNRVRFTRLVGVEIERSK